MGPARVLRDNGLRARVWIGQCVDPRLKPAHVSVALQRRLVYLHNTHHGIHVVRQGAHDGQSLVVQQHRAPRLQLGLVHEAHDVHIVFRPNRGGHDRVAGGAGVGVRGWGGVGEWG